MKGLEDDEDGPERYAPAPHPDDRLWRHPAEVAAMQAAAAEAAHAPTVEMPAVGTEAPSPSSVLHRGLLAAAAVVAVGATALAIGALSARGSNDGVASNVAAIAALEPTDLIDNVAVATEPGGEAALGTRLHERLADSLPRVEAATSDGMRAGSGAFIGADGLLVTSARLVAGSDYVLVWTSDGSRWHAEVVASDGFSDVALLQVAVDTETASFPTANFKDDAELWAGQYALTIDHDGGSMIVGEVSSLVGGAPSDGPGDRSSRFNVEPGMTPGAAIVDDSGAIIGMVNAASSYQATPSWMVERVAGDLLATGATEHSWLGVQIEPGTGGGHVRVTGIVAGSPAERAGLRIGDLIDAVDGDSISATTSLWTLIQRHSPGDPVALAVTRNSERRLITAELGTLE